MIVQACGHIERQRSTTNESILSINTPISTRIVARDVIWIYYVETYSWRENVPSIGPASKCSQVVAAGYVTVMVEHAHEAVWRGVEVAQNAKPRNNAQGTAEFAIGKTACLRIAIHIVSTDMSLDILVTHGRVQGWVLLKIVVDLGRR